MKFTGIERPDEFREITRAHVFAWRDDLKYRELSGTTIRHRLAALSSLFEYLCDKNAVTHNPVKGIKRPSVEGYQGKTPAIGDHQARALLESPKNVSVKDKRDRAILATLLYHALRREELCKLLVKDFKHERRGVAHLKVSGKGGKTRYIPLHPAAGGLILDYLEASGHGFDLSGALFRPMRTAAQEPYTRRLPPISFINWCALIPLFWVLRSGLMPYGQLRQQMRWITKRILPKCRNGWGMPILRPPGFMTTARPGRRIARRLR